MRNLLSRGMFVDIAKLTSGTAGGRVILLLAMPFVTRLYSPEDFDLLAVYAALVGMISIAACLRLEIAIPLADTDEDAATLLILSLLATATISAVLILLALVMPGLIASWLGEARITAYLPLVGLGVALSGSYLALQYWATRARRFGVIGRTRVGQASAGAATMLGLGWLGLSPVGLLLGHMFTVGAGGLGLARDALRRDRTQLRWPGRARMRETLYRHRRYPLFSMPEALANMAGIQIPVLMIAATSDSEAGQLFLAMQIMIAPLMLLGMSVGQVYASRVSEEMEAGSLYGFTRAMMRRLFLIGVGPMTLAAILAPVLVPVVFGADWLRAGVIITWIAPWMLLQLTVSPVSIALHAVGRQGTALVLQLFGCCIRCAAVPIGYHSAFGAVEAVAIAGAIFYLFYAAVVLLVTKRK